MSLPILHIMIIFMIKFVSNILINIIFFMKSNVYIHNEYIHWKIKKVKFFFYISLIFLLYNHIIIFYVIIMIIIYNKEKRGNGVFIYTT